MATGVELDWNDLAVERNATRDMVRSLRKRERLEGKLERVKLRLARAQRALAKKTLRASQQLCAAVDEAGPASSSHSLSGRRGRPEMSVLDAESGLPSWRKPYLEEYTFKSPVVHSLLSQGLAPEHRFTTEWREQCRDTSGSEDAKELRRLAKISDGEHGVVKSDFVQYAEDRIIFDRMMKLEPRRRGNKKGLGVN